MARLNGTVTVEVKTDDDGWVKMEPAALQYNPKTASFETTEAAPPGYEITDPAAAFTQPGARFWLLPRWSRVWLEGTLIESETQDGKQWELRFSVPVEDRDIHAHWPASARLLRMCDAPTPQPCRCDLYQLMRGEGHDSHCQDRV